MKKYLYISLFFLVPFIGLGQTNTSNTKTFKVRDIPFTMVYVQGGEYAIGLTSDQGRKVTSIPNDPVIVELSSYYIGQTEVTQELWEAVMGENPSEDKSDKKLPVTNVSWESCRIFLARLSNITGETFRFPTEAEWEVAARGGVKSEFYRYSGSNNGEEVGWTKENSEGRTHVVGTKKPNELNIYDMTGNVAEWCRNDKNSYNMWFLESGKNPKGKDDPSNDRIIRGGYYRTMAYPVSYRGSQKPDWGSEHTGLRLARSVKTVVIEQD